MRVTLLCDNLSIIYIASNPCFYASTKHIELHYHFMRGHILSGTHRVQFIWSTDQLANIITKDLDKIFLSFLIQSRFSWIAEFKGECKWILYCIVLHGIVGEHYSLLLVYIHGYNLRSMNEKESDSSLHGCKQLSNNVNLSILVFTYEYSSLNNYQI